MEIEEQVQFLMQGTSYGDEVLKDAMASELRERLVDAQDHHRPLRVYCGFDPRTSDLHIGHTIPMRKLRHFQELGHQVIFLVGNYTSLIGDPSDKDKLREQLASDQIALNARTYAEQAYRILDKDRTEIRYNAEWLSEISFEELIRLASNFTVQQFLSRDNFKKRWDAGEAIYIHETFYAIMQAYDAFMLKADVQVGGTDQLFNIVTAARKLMTYLGAKPNIAIITDILPGTDGEIKMSKSLGNHIPLNSGPDDMYGKVMSIPDKAMEIYATLVTSWRPNDIKRFKASVRTQPRDAKMELAKEIVSVYYDPATAIQSQEQFVRIFQKKNIPDDIPVYQLKSGQTVLDVLRDSGLVSSGSAGRRLIEQNAVRLDDELLTSPLQIFPNSGQLKVGKRRFLWVKSNPD